MIPIKTFKFERCRGCTFIILAEDPMHSHPVCTWETLRQWSEVGISAAKWSWSRPLTSAEIPSIEMVGHNWANVHHNEVVMGDGSQREVKTPAAHMYGQLCWPLFRLRSDSPLQCTIMRPSSRERDCEVRVPLEKKFWLFLCPMHHPHYFVSGTIFQPIHRMEVTSRTSDGSLSRNLPVRK